MVLEDRFQGGFPVNFSVIIPCFNAENYLEATVQSCLEQGDIVKQIIIVDDKSSDRSMEVMQNLAAQHRSVQVASSPRKGACAARNEGLRLANQDLIQWLDADDLLGQNKLSKAANFHRQHPSRLFACRWRPFSIQPGDELLTEDWKRWAGVPQLSSPSDWLAADLHMVPHCYSGERHLFEQAGPWDETLGINQDGEYFSRVVALSKGVTFSDQIEVHYRQSSSPSVSTFRPKKADSLFRSIESMALTGIALEDSQRMRQMVANRWQHFIYTTYPHCSELLFKANNHLQKLPKPTISNPIVVSSLSKVIATVFGWKTLTHLRLLRNQIKL